MLGVPRVKATRVAPFPPAAAAPLFGEVSGADATGRGARSDSRGCVGGQIPKAGVHVVERRTARAGRENGRTACACARAQNTAPPPALLSSTIHGAVRYTLA